MRVILSCWKAVTMTAQHRHAQAMLGGLDKVLFTFTNILRLFTFDMLNDLDTEAVAAVAPGVHAPHHVVVAAAHGGHAAMAQDARTFFKEESQRHQSKSKFGVRRHFV